MSLCGEAMIHQHQLKANNDVFIFFSYSLSYRLKYAPCDLQISNILATGLGLAHCSPVFFLRAGFSYLNLTRRLVEVRYLVFKTRPVQFPR
jgi:hypothetical protein